MSVGAKRGHQEGQPYIHNKIYLVFVRQCLSLTIEVNIVTWDRIVLVDSLVVGFGVDISRLLLKVIH